MNWNDRKRWELFMSDPTGRRMDSFDIKKSVRVSTCAAAQKLELFERIVYFGDTNFARCRMVEYQWLLKDLSPWEQSKERTKIERAMFFSKTTWFTSDV